MDERERSPAGREPAPTEATPDAAGTTQATSASTAWVATLPPPPFIDPASSPTEPRFAALSPRVAVLIVAAVVLGVVLWMARDAVRPFVLGLLLVYLLEPPVRWLVRRGMRRTFAILLVYVVAIVAIVEMINLTLTPLVNELVRFVQDFPALTVQLQLQIERLVGDLCPAATARRAPRLHRLGDRGHRPGRGRCIRVRLRDLPPGPDGCGQLHRGDLRLPAAPGLGVLPPQGPESC